jgi:hypothetical protein
VLGLPAAILVAGVVEGALRLAGAGGHVSAGYFVAIAAVAPVLALGLLVAIVTALAGRTRAILRELGSFEREMEAEPAEPDAEAHQRRVRTWEGVRFFLEALLPFVLGLALQFVVIEAVAIFCIAADVDRRIVALALGAEVVALLAYLVLFNAVVSVLARMRTTAEA